LGLKSRDKKLSPNPHPASGPYSFNNDVSEKTGDINNNEIKPI